MGSGPPVPQGHFSDDAGTLRRRMVEMKAKAEQDLRDRNILGVRLSTLEAQNAQLREEMARLSARHKEECAQLNAQLNARHEAECAQLKENHAEQMVILNRENASLLALAAAGVHPSSSL